MDHELEDLLDKNNTDELDDFTFHPTVWDVVQDSVGIVFTCVGVIANIVLIYLIVRNARMRTRTNLILLNFAINDLFFLFFNIHFLTSTLEVAGVKTHASPLLNCVIGFANVGFEFNEIIAILFIVSNTLMKSKRIGLRWLVGGMYTLFVCNFILHMFQCHYDIFYVTYLLCFLFLMVLLGVVVFKEFNNCYKKWHKKDPLSARTLFRLNIGRIYIGAWFSTFVLYMLAIPGMHHISFTLAQHALMTSMYILIYVVHADKNFKICLLNMLQCKGAGDYDVDATITFAEEESTDDKPDNNQVNINFNIVGNANASARY